MAGTKPVNLILGKAIFAAAAAAVLTAFVVILDQKTGIPPYWLQPRTLAWLFVGAIYILSAIYLALDELVGADVPRGQWLTLLVFGGIILIGINRSHLFDAGTLYLIAEYSLVFGALLLWSVIITFIIAINHVPPIHERLRILLRRSR